MYKNGTFDLIIDCVFYVLVPVFIAACCDIFICMDATVLIHVQNKNLNCPLLKYILL